MTMEVFCRMALEFIGFYIIFSNIKQAAYGSRGAMIEALGGAGIVLWASMVLR